MIVLIIMIGVIVVAVLLALLARWRRRPRQLKADDFQAKWQHLQKMCADKAAWREVVLDADNLLDEALRKKRLGGKNMGERLVRAQRLFTDNDGVWFGHKLRGRVEGEPKLRLKEKDVKEALMGIRQALKDLGALRK